MEKSRGEKQKSPQSVLLRAWAAVRQDLKMDQYSFLGNCMARMRL